MDGLASSMEIDSPPPYEAGDSNIQSLRVKLQQVESENNQLKRAMECK